MRTVVPSTALYLKNPTTSSTHTFLHLQERYEDGYGTVLDSGTTFTYLPTDAFTKFQDAVTTFALEHGLHVVKGPDPKVQIFNCSLLLIEPLFSGKLGAELK